MRWHLSHARCGPHTQSCSTLENEDYWKPPTPLHYYDGAFSEQNAKMWCAQSHVVAWRHAAKNMALFLKIAATAAIKMRLRIPKAQDWPRLPKALACTKNACAAAVAKAYCVIQDDAWHRGLRGTDTMSHVENAGNTDRPVGRPSRIRTL